VLHVLRQRNFALLWFAGLISVAGDFALIVALPLHVYRETDSTIATAAVFAARFVPSILIGSVAGVFVDRWDRKRTMIWADLLRALTVLLLVLAISADLLALVFLVAAIQGSIGLFFDPAESALLPLLVGEEHLVTANALNALNNNLGRLIGPAIGAWLYSAGGLDNVAVVDALTYVASATLIALIVAPSRTEQRDRAPDQPLVRGLLGEWKEGLGIVRQSRPLRVIFCSAVLAYISEGAFVTLALAPLVLDVLGGTDAQVGWINSAQAVGGLIGGMVVAHYGRRFTKRWLLGGGMIGLGLADMAQFNARRIAGPGTPAVMVAMVCMMLAGFPAVAMGTGGQSLMQDLTEDHYRGRVFGALTAVQGVAVLVGLTLAGVLGEVIGIVPVLTAGSALCVAGGFVVVVFLEPGVGEKSAPYPPNPPHYPLDDQWEGGAGTQG
jgi:MFS family permease